MIFERLSSIAIIVYFIFSFVVIGVCFTFIGLNLNPDLNIYLAGIISSLITSLKILVIHKLLKLHQRRLDKLENNIKQEIKRSSSNSSNSL